mmetsp:Transcript_2777/g.6631  ORF Transcript_2777/g.6631 Transcript_2777/m.6631 type:complete len:145 (-) Transcript_2777:111-545(-)
MTATAATAGPKGHYTGELKGKFVKHGKGVLSYTDGAVYDGEFKDGVFHGMGTFTWAATGESYTGWWEDGQMHGKGRFDYASGGTYVGGFSRGKMHGFGKLTIKMFAEDGGETVAAKEGQWADGVFTAPPEEGGGKPKSAKKKKK